MRILLFKKCLIKGNIGLLLFININIFSTSIEAHVPIFVGLELDNIGSQLKTNEDQLLKSSFNNYVVVEFELKSFIKYVRPKNVFHQKVRDVHLIMGPANWEFSMIPADIHTSDFQLTTNENGKLVALPKEPNKSFYGYLKGSKYEVRMTLAEDYLSGVIFMDNHQIYIEPKSRFIPGSPSNHFVIYNSADVKHKKIDCSWTDNLYKVEQLKNDKDRLKVNTCIQVRIGIASGAGIFADIGSVAGVNNFTTTVFNNVAPLYRQTFSDNIEFVIARQFVSQAQEDDPLVPNTTSDDALVLLNNFYGWVDAENPGFGSSVLDLYQIYMKRDLTPTARSYFCNIWNTKVAHILEYKEGAFNNAAHLAGLVAHETGHNFNASHQSDGIPNVMDPTGGQPLVWHPNTIIEINANLFETCLSECTELPIAEIVSTAGGCIGSDLTLVDRSKFGGSRIWTMNGGLPASGSDVIQNVAYENSGFYTINLKSINTIGSDSISRSLFISTMPSDICPPDGLQGDGGISKFGLANVYKTSDSGEGLDERLEDFSCTDVVQLEKSTFYSLTDFYIVGDAQRFRIYIDYNNDGDFLDAEEEVITSLALNITGNIVEYLPLSFISFTTPPDPVENKLLRMRLLVDNEIPTGPCHNPAYGQVEDYSVMFKLVAPDCDETVDLNGVIADGTYHFTDELSASGIVPSNGNVILKAPNGINLFPGFNVQGPSALEASIEFCYE